MLESERKTLEWREEALEDVRKGLKRSDAQIETLSGIPLSSDQVVYTQRDSINAEDMSLRAARGTSVSSEKSSQALEVLKIVAEPFIQYARALNELQRPDNIADRIADGRFGIADILRYSIAAFVVMAIIARIFHQEAGLTGTPYVDEVLNGLLTLCAGLVNIIFHLALKMVGGKARFAQTAYACIYVSLCYMPLITIMEGFVKTGASATFVGIEIVQLTAILARLHGLSRKRKALILWLTVLVIGVIVFAVLYMSSS